MSVFLRDGSSMENLYKSCKNCNYLIQSKTLCYKEKLLFMCHFFILHIVFKLRLHMGRNASESENELMMLFLFSSMSSLLSMQLILQQQVQFK